ncbi:hypothetical protein SD51_13390 [Alicyclobacillus tengchongensis]|nr:hypothetical protein SD51_13390 [Alicyclobacillus tengchongensis]
MKALCSALVALSILALAGCGTDALNTTNRPAANVSKLISSTKAMTYKTYTNPRFGFFVEYPAAWRVGPRPTDGDGRWFTTPSGDESFDNGYGSTVPKTDVILQAVGTINTVSGSGNGYNFAQMVDIFKKNLQDENNQPGFISESYSVVPNRWIVVNLVTKVGTSGIQYSKTYVSLHTNQTITMTFPTNKRTLYLPIWDYVSQKFQPGNKPG